MPVAYSVGEAIRHRTDQRLLDLIERARHHVMTPIEKFDQRVSFVFAQQDWSSGNALPKERIREMLTGDGGGGC